MSEAAVVLAAHGTVDSLDELPELLANIRRGKPAPPELLAEVRRRYQAIGGKSPLNDINREVAQKLEAKLGMPVRLTNRLFKPYPKDVLTELASGGAKTIYEIPLAQHSAQVYGAAVAHAAKEIPGIERVIAAPNWGRTPELTIAFARSIADTFGRVQNASSAALVLTAHSLPKAAIAAGDAYEKEFRGSCDDVVKEVRKRASFGESVVAFQSAGMSGGDWLGPDLRTSLEGLSKRGVKSVVVAPIGFLADHVEILYDLDIEARTWAGELGIVLYRSASLNAGDALVDALAVVAQNLAKAAAGER
jgi:ferrochelatase